MRGVFTTSPTSYERQRQQERAREYAVKIEGIEENSGRQKQRGRAGLECTRDKGT